jgi:CHAT domain-containing protein
MAQAALQGQSRILPAALPWSYITGAGKHVSPPASKMPSKARTLVVTNVTPPMQLQLPPLSRQSPDRMASMTTVLAGPNATPARVIDEMRDADIIRFHTHALMDAGISDASYLVLSDDDGRFQLTAEAIRRLRLERHPIVVLAACNAAQGARYQHAPWSLPDAFLAVGARAVFAAAAPIPDLEAEPFFTRVLDRIAAGADPAVALRDERLEALAGNPSSWAADVMLFERIER